MPHVRIENPVCAHRVNHSGLDQRSNRCFPGRILGGAFTEWVEMGHRRSLYSFYMVGPPTPERAQADLPHPIGASLLTRLAPFDAWIAFPAIPTDFKTSPTTLGIDWSGCKISTFSRGRYEIDICESPCVGTGAITICAGLGGYRGPQPCLHGVQTLYPSRETYIPSLFGSGRVRIEGGWRRQAEVYLHSALIFYIAVRCGAMWVSPCFGA